MSEKLRAVFFRQHGQWDVTNDADGDTSAEYSVLEDLDRERAVRFAASGEVLDSLQDLLKWCRRPEINAETEQEGKRLMVAADLAIFKATEPQEGFEL